MTRTIRVLALLSLALLAGADPWADEKKTFIPKFRDADPVKRAEAVRGLKEARTPEAIDLLAGLYVVEPDAGVQQALADVMGGVIDGEGRKRFYEICKLGKPDNRAKLVSILSRGGNRDLMDVLKSLARDPEPMVRRSALEVMAATRWDSLEPSARAALGDAEPYVRIAAAKVLGKFKTEESAAALIRVLEIDTEADVRTAAADALGDISGQKFGVEPEPWKGWLVQRKGVRVAQPAVDRAIDAAGRWILRLREKGYDGKEETLELELYALVHAGVALDNPVVVSAISQLYKKPLTRTYNVALGAMALGDISLSVHQKWLALAADFLVNSQAENGQFGYGTTTPLDTPTAAPPAISGGAPEMGKGSRATSKIIVRRNPKRKIDKHGDNSNTQYAILGLRICADAGVEIPRDVWLDCLKVLKGGQNAEGTFTYSPLYGYIKGSIHTSALGAYIVCRWYSGHGAKRDTVIDKGLDWLSDNFAVNENPKAGNPREWLHYYLYGMERVGVLADTETFGKHEWYQEGARYLIQQQTVGGDWNNDVKDTSWAILFLRRATRPIGNLEDK